MAELTDISGVSAGHVFLKNDAERGQNQYTMANIF